MQAIEAQEYKNTGGKVSVLNRWAADEAEEDAMNDDHRHLWRQMIDLVEEPDLTAAHVLDYGCNQGGFLQLLYSLKPFAKGVGVDLALQSLERAAAQVQEGVPLTFAPVESLEKYQGSFDLAFSHEVLYLLPDLKAHADLIRRALKPGGVYYAAIGCHTDNPQWQRWVDLISTYSNIPVQNYSLDDYARAFFDAGFAVSARSYKFRGFVPLKRDNEYFPRVRDSLDYHDTHKTLFRFVNR